MAKLTVYDPVFGAFFKKTEDFDRVRNDVKKIIGEATFKAGFSAGNPGGATKALKDAFEEKGIAQVEVEGVIREVGFVETSDGAGNLYQKVRVKISGAEELLLSIDLNTDVAKRLIAKLLNCSVGESVKISAWPVLENKNNRTFINHSVSIKTVFGEEIPVVPGLFAKAKTNGEDAIKKLAEAGINDKKVLESVKKGEQVKLFKAELERCTARFGVAA